MPKKYDKVTDISKPDWLKIKLPMGTGYAAVASIVRKHSLHTICSSGLCPNRAECWSRRTATFMIMGDICTRGCKFCATKTGKTLPLDELEPQKVADSIRLMGLKHAVITSVTRDDLADGGAQHWARVVEAVREVNPETTIELLIPDLDAKSELVGIVLASRPHIVGHNIETVERLTPTVRSRAKYHTSLRTIELIAKGGGIAKSGIMLGMGETVDEVLQTLDDLRSAGCRIVTLGQYLQPTKKHYPVMKYVTPERFEWFKQRAQEKGFDYVASAPLVRSSYLAEQALEHCGC